METIKKLYIIIMPVVAAASLTALNIIWMEKVFNLKLTYFLGGILFYAVLLSMSNFVILKK
jgi:hypothetical protein